MALQKDTENFLLLLSSFNKEQEKVNDIYIEQIKQTDEYKMLENIKDYEFISKTAKDLKSKLQQINIKMQSITQIREEYRKLITLTNDWLKLMDESRK